MTTAYIVDALRTPVGRIRGVFARTRADDMFAMLIKELKKRNPSVPLDRTDDVIVGCALPEAEQSFNIARIALLLGGLPDSVPGFTVNRLCSSGLQAIALAAERVASGHADIIIAGGLESMSLVPMLGNKQAFNPSIFENENVAIAYGMGITAEKVAQKYKISREEQDAYSLRSHQRACKAQEDGDFKDEIMPVPTVRRQADLKTGEVRITKELITQDEGPRPNTNLEKLAQLRTPFAANGTVTAGNSSQMSDGAAALLIISEQLIKKHELQPMALLRGFSVAGVPPEIMGIGPIKAIPLALAQTGIKQTDISWIELNEAFAAQTLAVIQDLTLDQEIVNPLGGAIALGHPLGATGAIRTATLLHNMKNKKLPYGMVTMCIGTGMGAAGIFQLC